MAKFAWKMQSLQSKNIWPLRQFCNTSLMTYYENPHSHTLKFIGFKLHICNKDVTTDGDSLVTKQGMHWSITQTYDITQI